MPLLYGPNRARRTGRAEGTQPKPATAALFRLRDENMEDSATIPPPDVIADEILEGLQGALEQLEGNCSEYGA